MTGRQQAWYDSNKTRRAPSMFGKSACETTTRKNPGEHTSFKGTKQVSENCEMHLIEHSVPGGHLQRDDAFLTL